jgi:membrane-associated protein
MLAANICTARMIPDLINIFLHIDQNLPLIIQEYGFWTYLILFVIIFFETGFVITPYLPGDSLLFVAGICAAGELLDLRWLLIVFILGAIVGDTVNYWIGNYCGTNLRSRLCRIFSDQHFEKTRHFFDRYGGKTIFIARFIPMVRTFAPFLAGVGSMNYSRFLAFNVLGAVAWSVIIVLAGYYMGTIPLVQTNLNLLVYAVILLTLVTVVYIIYKLAQQWHRAPEGE